MPFICMLGYMFGCMFIMLGIIPVFIPGAWIASGPPWLC